MTLVHGRVDPRAYRRAPACWAHHSWLGTGRPVRHERAARAAHVFLFDRYPQLLQTRSADLPEALPWWPRPACARLCRIAAALVLAPALRRIVAAPARAAFAAGVAPRMLEALQRHPRAAMREFGVAASAASVVSPSPSPSPFDRREMTAFGLALAQRACADPDHAFWWSLRLPHEIALRARFYSLSNLTVAAAGDVLVDARRLMEASRC